MQEEVRMEEGQKENGYAIRRMKALLLLSLMTHNIK